MKLFIDTSDPREILSVRDWGILDGVTTNPSLIARGGKDMQETLRRVLDASPGPVLCQAVGWGERDALAGQARWLHRLSERIVVKLPMSPAGIQALLLLKKEDPGMQIAVTLVCSVAQAYLAAKAGADVVALFAGPLDQVQDQEVDLVAPVRRMYDVQHYATQILACGRYPRSFGEFAAAGAHICTLRLEFITLLYEHPFTEKRMRGFSSDWQAAFGGATWPAAGL